MLLASAAGPSLPPIAVDAAGSALPPAVLVQALKDRGAKVSVGNDPGVIRLSVSRHGSPDFYEVTIRAPNGEVRRRVSADRLSTRDVARVVALVAMEAVARGMSATPEMAGDAAEQSRESSAATPPAMAAGREAPRAAIRAIAIAAAAPRAAWGARIEPEYSIRPWGGGSPAWWVSVEHKRRRMIADVGASWVSAEVAPTAEDEPDAEADINTHSHEEEDAGGEGAGPRSTRSRLVLRASLAHGLGGADTVFAGASADIASIGSGPIDRSGSIFLGWRPGSSRLGAFVRIGLRGRVPTAFDDLDPRPGVVLAAGVRIGSR